MKLTKEDKKRLLEMGHPEEELEHLQKAANIAKYKIYANSDDERDKRIGAREAVALLGRDTWLSGISRAAFHWDCARTTLDGRHEIDIDCSALFR